MRRQDQWYIVYLQSITAQVSHSSFYQIELFNFEYYDIQYYDIKKLILAAKNLKVHFLSKIFYVISENAMS